LREAELFYWIGPDLESFLRKPLQGREGPSIAAQALPGISLRHFGENQQRHEHDHDHREGSLDVHLWLLPQNAVLIARRMAEDLQRIDPTNSARYLSNLARFEAHLSAVDQSLRERLTGLAGKPFFVFHETYDYFEQAYGLKHAGVFSMGSEVQPGARQVAAMRSQLEAAGDSCVFSEPPMPPRLAQTLSQGLPVKLAELDALGVHIAPGPQGYAQLLENLGNDLIDCLSRD
jgi:zinc transport system substrate-binding protein